MRALKNVFTTLVLLAACFAVPAWAQQITGQGAAGYTSNEWYDRSTKDSNTKVDRYLACARQGLYYMPDNPQAEGNCAMIDLVGFRIAPDRSTLQFETTTKGVWGDVVTIKGDTGPDGQAELCAGWSTGTWGECQSNNTRTRSVTCSGANCCGPQPTDSEPCTYVPPVCTPWSWSEWSACDAGQTTQTRSASCPFADVSRCCERPNPTTETQACPEVCDGTWIFQGWGGCNDGVQQAQYSCSTACCTGTAPVETQACEGSSSGGSGVWVPQYGTCNATPSWHTTEWGNCGPAGNQSRTVTCINQEGQRPVSSYTCSTSSGCAEPQPVGEPGQSCSLTCQGAGLTQPPSTQPCTPPGGDCARCNIAGGPQGWLVDGICRQQRPIECGADLGVCRCRSGMKPWGYGGVIYGCVPSKPEGVNYTHATEPCLTAELDFGHGCPCITLRSTGTHCLPTTDYSGSQCPTGFARHVGTCAGGDRWDFSGMGPGMNNVGAEVCNYAR